MADKQLTLVETTTPTPKYGKGDACWHTARQLKVIITGNPTGSLGRFTYPYEYLDPVGQQFYGTAPEPLLEPWDSINEVKKGEQVKVNLQPATPIKKLIEDLAPSLPNGGEIAKDAGTLSRSIIKERKMGKGSFQGIQDFCDRMEKYNENLSVLWRAIAEKLDYTTPERPILE